MMKPVTPAKGPGAGGAAVGAGAAAGAGGAGTVSVAVALAVAVPDRAVSVKGTSPAAAPAGTAMATVNAPEPPAGTSITGGVALATNPSGRPVMASVVPGAAALAAVTTLECPRAAGLDGNGRGGRKGKGSSGRGLRRFS